MARNLPRSRGALIVFEGCDRVGKSTQCGKLVEALNRNGVKTQLIKFPDRTTTIGQQIDAYLSQKAELEDHAIHLLFSANRWELVPKMTRLLNSGVSLVVDRYAFSGVAFTAAKKIAPLSWCKCPDVGLPAPDLIVYLKLSAEVAKQREKYGSERYERSEFQEEVERQFAQLAEKEEAWQELDASQPIEPLHDVVMSLAQKIIAEKSSTPIGELWKSTSAE